MPKSRAILSGQSAPNQVKTEVCRVDGIYTNRLEETALSRASRYGSSIFKRERGAAPNHRAGRRGVKYRGRAGAAPGPTATGVRRRVGLDLIPVTGGRRQGDGSAALDSAMGTELSRRSR